MPNPRNAYKRVTSGCTRGCSLNPEKLPAGLGQLVHHWFEEGCNDREIIARAAPLGVKLSNGAVSRHRAGHVHAVPVAGETRAEGEPAKQLSDLEVIEAVIQTGAQQVRLSGAKVTTEQLLAAIALKHKLTEGSVFDAMFDAMSGFEDDDMSDLEGEAVDAVRSDEEQAQEAAPNGQTEGR